MLSSSSPVEPASPDAETVVARSIPTQTQEITQLYHKEDSLKAFTPVLLGGKWLIQPGYIFGIKVTDVVTNCSHQVRTDLRYLIQVKPLNERSVALLQGDEEGQGTLLRVLEISALDQVEERLYRLGSQNALAFYPDLAGKTARVVIQHRAPHKDTCVVWDLTNQDQPKKAFEFTMPRGEDALLDCCFAGNKIYLTQGFHVWRLDDLDSDKRKMSFVASPGIGGYKVAGLVYAPSSDRLVSSLSASKFVFVDSANKNTLKTWEPPEMSEVDDPGLLRISLVADGKHFLCWNEGADTIHLWDIEKACHVESLQLRLNLDSTTHHFRVEHVAAVGLHMQVEISYQLEESLEPRFGSVVLALNTFKSLSLAPTPEPLPLVELESDYVEVPVAEPHSRAEEEVKAAPVAAPAVGYMASLLGRFQSLWAGEEKKTEGDAPIVEKSGLEKRM